MIWCNAGDVYASAKAAEPIQLPEPALESSPQDDMQDENLKTLPPAHDVDMPAEPHPIMSVPVHKIVVEIEHPENFLEKQMDSVATPKMASLSQDVENSYKLAPGDVLGITVFNEPDLSKDYTISNNGIISMPLIGDIGVEGLTISQAQGRITDGLANGYLIDPSVSIELEQKRSFYILGEVRAPGSYDYVNNMSILNAVAMAGGFTYRADQKEADIIREQGYHKHELDDISIRTKVVPGDIIVIEERFF